MSSFRPYLLLSFLHWATIGFSIQPPLGTNREQEGWLSSTQPHQPHTGRGGTGQEGSMYVRGWDLFSTMESEQLFIKISPLRSTYKGSFSGVYGLVTSAQMCMGIVRDMFDAQVTYLFYFGNPVIKHGNVKALWKKALELYFSIRRGHISHHIHFRKGKDWIVPPEVFLHTPTRQPETGSRVQNFNPNRQSLTNWRETLGEASPVWPQGYAFSWPLIN